MAVLAQSPGPSPQDKAKDDRDAKAEEAKSKEKPEYPDFKEVTDGMEQRNGLFTLWFYPEGAKGKDSERLLCQIPKGFLGQKFMLSSSVAGGGLYTGFPLDERAVQWEEFNRMLLLVQPETRYVLNEKSTVNDVVRRTYPDRIRASVPIVTKAPSGDPLIDLGPLLKSDFADIAWTADSSGGGGGRINPQLSRWSKKKVFPHNVEICVELAVSQSSPPGAYEKRLVHYSLWELQKTDYRPRTGDDRVGYFLTANQDWSKPTAERDIFNRYIDRWNLQKRDPSLELCEPVQPIVFYVEKTVPIRFRRAVQDGILEWNKAYEKVGLHNAIQVRQQTDDNEWKDLDPEDMRYSFFRWIVTGEGFAMGPHRANPFTGEIYDADIIFDDSMVRYYEQDLGQMTPEAVYAMKTNEPILQRFLEQFPQWQRPQQDWARLDKDDTLAVRKTLQHRLCQRQGWGACDYMEGMKHQMAVAGAVLAGQPKEVLERFLYDVVKEVATHEVGHTLGLRHNFAGSSVYTLDEILRRRGTEEATCGSIMDYNPVLFFKDRPTEGHFITPTIGPYDYWAIEYGYRAYDPSAAKATKADKPEDPYKAGKDAKDKGRGVYLASLQGEALMLYDIASRASEPELVYATDEDTVGVQSPDPRTNRFDMGSDPFTWAQSRFDLVDQRMNTLLDWAVKDGESWYHARNVFVRLLAEKVRVLDYVGRYAGGEYFSRSHRADPNVPAPFSAVEPMLQRKALDFVEKTLFEDRFFQFKPELLNHMAPPRWYHEGTMFNLDYVTVSFPVHEYIATLQWWNLSDRLFPQTLIRIYDAEMKTADPDKVTAAEYLQRIQRACWGPSLKDESRNILDVRRSLQREYLGLMEPLVRTQPGRLLPPDLHAMVVQNLVDLTNQIQARLNQDMDFASRAHLQACKSRIDRMLKSELREI